MNSITFLHIADLHLDSPFTGLKNIPEGLFKRIRESTFLSFSRLIQVAIREKVDFVIISGDIFDTEDRSIRAQSRFKKEMQRLNDHNIQVFIVHGNHDHLGGEWFEITWPSNVHSFSSNQVEVKSFIKSDECKVNLYGFSYPQRAVVENMTKYYKKQNDGSFHIGILHGSIDGDSNHNRYAPFRLEDLVGKQFDYWALGHIHKKQVLSEQPLIIYPGNIQGRHRKELGEKGGYLIRLSDADIQYQFYDTADIIWEKVKVPISNLDNLSDLLSMLVSTIHEQRRENAGVFLLIELIGTGPVHEHLIDKTVLDDLHHALVEEEEDFPNFVYCVSLNLQSSWVERERQALLYETSFIQDLLDLIQSYDNLNEATSTLYEHPVARKYLEMLTPEEKRDVLREAEEYLIHSILRHEMKG